MKLPQRGISVELAAAKDLPIIRGEQGVLVTEHGVLVEVPLANIKDITYA